MPYNTPAPDFALIASFDAREWSSVDVLAYDGTDVSIPTYSTGSGVYEDGLYFLNGRGVGDTTPTDAAGTFTEAISSLANFGTTWTVTLTEADRIKVTSDVSFSVSPLGDDVLGLGTQTAVVDGANYSVTASTDWTRGNYRGEQYRFDNGSGTTFDAFRVGALQWPAQDAICAMRSRATADLDNLSPTDCLEELIRDQTGQELRIILNDIGHVEIWYVTAAFFAFLNDSFRSRLGFSGNEYATSFGTLSRLVADYPMPCALFPSRPFQDHHYQVDSLTEARRLIGGGYTSNLIGTYTTSQLAFDLDALLDERDLYRHFTDAFIPYAPNGERVNFYQTWGDSRRSLRSALVTSNQDAYDLIYTSEDNGDCGRLRCSLVSASYDLAFGSLKRRVPVNMRLEHL
jgi:hypothetical protein